MAQVAIPAAIMAGSAIVKKLRKPAALTPQGTQAQGNLLGNAGSLRDAGNSLLGSGAALQKTGMGAFNKANADLNIPMNYYRTIAGGSRGAMTAAMAPEMGAITSAYRGAESALDRGPARGALRDVAGADIAREKAGKISGLALNARGGAMSSLAGLAAQQQGAGLSLMGVGQQNNALGIGALTGTTAPLSQIYSGEMRRTEIAGQNQAEAGKFFASLLFEMLKARMAAGGGGGGGS